MLIDTVPEFPLDYHPKHRATRSRVRMNRDPMFDLPTGAVKLAVEVGSQWGYFAYRAVRHNPGLVLHCIDPWREDAASVNAWKGKNFLTWCWNLKEWIGSRVFGHRGVSADFIDEFGNESVDLVFIDGDHRRGAVASDCLLWWPKVRPGGVLVGHDIDGQWGREVRLGVEMVFGKSYSVDGLYWVGNKRLSPCWWKRKGEDT